MIKPNRDREHGQSLIIIFFFTAALLALIAIVVDVGNAYAHRRIVKNAVDAASLAGTRQLAEHGLGDPPQTVLHVQVLRTIRDYAEANGLARERVEAWFIDAAGAEIDDVRNTIAPVPADAEGVRVRGWLTFETYFAHLLGYSRLTVDATTPSWKLQGPCELGDLFPITLIDSTFAQEPGKRPVLAKTYTLWDTQDLEAPGSFGWIYWDPNGFSEPPDNPPKDQGPTAETLMWNMYYTERSGIWNVGEYVPSSVGIQFTLPIRKELERRIDSTDPGVNTVCIPIYDETNDQGGLNAKFRIVGFGAFRLTCYHHSDSGRKEIGDCSGVPHDPADKYIRGEFVAWTTKPFGDGCKPFGIVAASFRNPHPPPAP
jgi:hypothetical protein